MLNYFELINTEVKSKVRDNWIMLPVGSIEQHGPHLPLSVDTDIAKAICVEIAQQENFIVAPEISYSTRSLSFSGGGDAFIGSVYLSGSTFIQYLSEILQSYFENGVNKIVIVNGHFENISYIYEAIELCRAKQGLNDKYIIALNWWDILSNEYMATVTNNKFKSWNLEHAGIVETSLQLFIKPDTVKEFEGLDFNEIRDNFYSHPILNRNKSKNGSLSSPHGANAKIGSDIFYYICTTLKNKIRELEKE